MPAVRFSPDVGTGTTATLDASGCVYQGPEYCTDGLDNDCDGAIDFSDTDCPQNPLGESCKDVVPLQIGQTYAGTFDKTTDDFTSRCASKMPDRIYGFTLQQEGYVSVTVTGTSVFSWSLQEGSCTPEFTQIYELTCGSTPTQNYMKANSPIWLVLEGPSGGYEFRVDFALTKG
jgi:hypothetical protein